ncbi:MAG: Crp/Fnr family transcriptional regulator [Burkholderiales bacterium]
MSTSLANILDDLDLFQRFFDFHELECLSTYMTIVSAPKGTIIFREGEKGGYMLILIDGKMEVSKSGDGGMHLLSYEGKGRVLGEMALIDFEPRSATCVASSNCEMVSLSVEGLDKLVAEHPRVAYKLMFVLARLLSRRLRRTSGLLADLVNA